MEYREKQGNKKEGTLFGEWGNSLELGSVSREAYLILVVNIIF